VSPNSGKFFSVSLVTRGSLMVSALVTGSSGPGSSPDRGHRVVFSGKTLYSHSAFLHPCRCINGVTANLLVGVTPRWTIVSSRGE